MGGEKNGQVSEKKNHSWFRSIMELRKKEKSPAQPVKPAQTAKPVQTTPPSASTESAVSVGTPSDGKEQKKQEFQTKYAEASERIKTMETVSEYFKDRQITHNPTAQLYAGEMKNSSEQAQSIYADLRSGYADLKTEKEVSYAWKMLTMGNRLERVKKSEEKITHAAEKSAAARKLFDEETGNKRLMTLVRKIAALSGSEMGDFKLVPGQTSGTAGTASPAQQPTQDTPSAFWKRQEKVEEGTEVYETYEAPFIELASGINDAVQAHFEMKDVKGIGVDLSNQGLGGGMAVVGAIASAFGAWNTFTKMYKTDKERRERALETGEKKDAEDRWQDAREGLQAVVDLISNTLGAIGTFGADALSGILGLIGNCAVLLTKFISIADSSVRVNKINVRKYRLWQRIKQKREKYKASGELESSAYYELPFKFSFAKEIKAKRRALRTSLAQMKDRDGHAIATEEAVSSVSTEKFQHIEKTYGEDYTDLESKIQEEKEHRKTDKSEDRTVYKKRVRMMEALELIEQYYELDQAQDRQVKILGHSVEDSVTESASVLSNLAKVSVIGATAGQILAASNAIYKVASKTTKFAVKKIRANLGHENDKAFRRNEMAMTLVKSVEDLTKDGKYALQGGKKGNVEAVEDYRLTSAAERLSHVHGMMTGLDIHLSPLMAAQNKGEFLQSLSSAFSEEGNG